MALPHALGFGVLLALPGALGSEGGGKDSAGSNSTIFVLLFLLLILITGLALAWRRLSRDSGGYYHPARLGAALWGHTRRLLWASPPGRWLRARAEMEASEDPAEDPERQDERVADHRFLTNGGQEAPEPRKAEQPCSAGAPAGREPEEAEACDTDSEGGLAFGSQGPVCSGGSAEALLSDMHAFSGSAAWDDSAGGAGGQGLHVTAL